MAKPREPDWVPEWVECRVLAAGATVGLVAPVRIEIGPETIEDDPLYRPERFAEQAKLIVDALYAGLPGGTVDHVTAELLRRQATRIVRHAG